MDLITAYSKRQDLADALVRAVRRIERPRERVDVQLSAEALSVHSTAKSDRKWRVADRLTKADMRLLVAAFESGTPKWRLAEQYGISESSVKRLVRKSRSQPVAKP